ncbi:MAG: carbohydrate ABC transporter permease [Sphaerochaeta sp.]|jgi:multiple sugar transport system permease protein|uniref:carbohydrate ABC transporter permease n=1 Tax=unclassified Sphaerochaeta TaxID=2637943 RepID=UPI000AB4E7C5|nr:MULTISPECIES: carbohydrate ABC transporter permease [unclassified Sphaerochaeta]MCK9599940.1 carbohydrate ABC transporter permease [Sphaerochaeta sp.]MDX9823452.1 carbohydrate ABC transporter permease [Sphaerochaeta sp.]
MKPYTLQRHLGNFGRTVILLVFLLLVILPIYWMFITSFKTNAEIINAQQITYFPREITTENYVQLFKLYDYKGMLTNSLVVSVSTGLCITLLSILGGYGLARYTFKGKDAMLLFFLVTQMIPGILVIIPLYVIFAKLGMINTRLSLFFFYLITNLPFCVITMRSFFERIPYTLEEAAYVDGCSKLTTLVRIVLPVMFPGIVAVFVFAFIGAWNELIAGTIFINTADLWTIPVGLKSLIGKYDVKWGVLMAGGVCALLPTAIMFAFMQKFVVEGLTAGAVKE